MAVIKVPTNFNIDLEFEIPEFYRRMFALMIDMLIEYFYLRIASAIYDSIDNNRNSFDSDAGYDMAAIGILLFLPVLIYHVVLEITMNGQSIGKKIMRLRVVDENGGRPSISQYLIRWLLRLGDVWIVAAIFLLFSMPAFFRDAESAFLIIAVVSFLITDIVLVVFSKKGQRLGDILAKTILIRLHTKTDIEDTVFQEVSDSYIPKFPEIMKLNDKDINAIKNILDTARKKGDFNMATAASEKIKAHLKIETPLSPFDFLDIALKDYNYLSTK
jgi:uncharacterized RDD family membrane protein YckC